jgi:hypothetical protein
MPAPARAIVEGEEEDENSEIQPLALLGWQREENSEAGSDGAAEAGKDGAEEADKDQTLKGDVLKDLASTAADQDEDPAKQPQEKGKSVVDSGVSPAAELSYSAKTLIFSPVGLVIS